MNSPASPSVLWITCVMTLTLIAFAANTVLCRLALATTDIDPLSFTALRMASGALTLVVLVLLFRPGGQRFNEGSWRGAGFLMLYALPFSVAYRFIDTGPGALILFATVQISMLSYGFAKGERATPLSAFGLVLSCAGLAWLLLPGSSAPPLLGSALMVLAGLGWACYTLNSRGIRDPLATTCGNFVRATPIAVVALLLFLTHAEPDSMGVLYACLSGSVASGMGYALWYAVAKHISVLKASALQLLVPIISAAFGVWLLSEPASWRLVGASVAVLGGVGLVLVSKARRLGHT